MELIEGIERDIVEHNVDVKFDSIAGLETAKQLLQVSAGKCTSRALLYGVSNGASPNKCRKLCCCHRGCPSSLPGFDDPGEEC